MLYIWLYLGGLVGLLLVTLFGPVRFRVVLIYSIPLLVAIAVTIGLLVFVVAVAFSKRSQQYLPGRDPFSINPRLADFSINPKIYDFTSGFRKKKK